MPFVDVEGVSLYYEVHGEGPAVAFAHGNGGSTLCYWQQVHYFSRSYQVLLFDHRGFGRSRCPVTSFHPRFFVSDFEAILDHAGIRTCAIVCQSMGGLTGLPFALAHPDRVTALVLGSTPGGIATRQIAADFARRQAGELPPNAEFVLRNPERAFLIDQIKRLAPEEVVQASLARSPEIRIRSAELEGFRTPTLVIAGSEDPIFSVAGLREVADRIPGASFLVMHGAGHGTYWELPDHFNRVVDAFLRNEWPPRV